MKLDQLIDRLMVPAGEKIRLHKDYPTDWLPKGMDKDKAEQLLTSLLNQPALLKQLAAGTGSETPAKP